MWTVSLKQRWTFPHLSRKPFHHILRVSPSPKQAGQNWGTSNNGYKRQSEGIEANRQPALGARTLHPAELTVCCRLIRFSWHGASCPREILRFSSVPSPEVQKRRGADVDFQAAWAHVSNQEHQASPRGASDWWRESVRNLVSVHQDKFRGSAILCRLCGRISYTGGTNNESGGGQQRPAAAVKIVVFWIVA